MLDLGVGLFSLPVLDGGVIGASSPIVVAQTAAAQIVARAFEPIPVAQIAVVQVAARAFEPIIVAQTASVEIVASEGDSYTPLDEDTGGDTWVAWIDMQDPTAYTLNGGSTGVTQVKNKISNVQWGTPVNDTPYEATGLNGHPCLHPIVVGDRIQSTEAAVVAAFDCPTTAKPYTIFYVVDPDSATTGVATFGVGNSGVSSQSTRTWGQRSGVSQYEYAQTAPASVSTIRSTGAVNTGRQVACWRSHSAGVGVKLQINNGSDDPNDTTTTPAYTPGTGPNQFALFARPDLGPDSSAVQRFGEIWIAKRELDAAARTRVHDWLAAKWA